MSQSHSRSVDRWSRFTPTLLTVLLAACGSSSTAPTSGTPSTPGAPTTPTAFTIAADTTTVREAQLFGVRLRGARTADSVVALVGGAPAPLRVVNDSVVELFMPFGQAGSTQLEVRVGRTGTPRTATLAVTRVAAPAVAAPGAFLDSIRTTLTASATQLEARPVPVGVSPSAWAADVAVARLMADSLARSIARLSPTEQAEAARIIAAAAAGPAQAALRMQAVAAAECRQTRAAALLCLNATETNLRFDLQQLTVGIATTALGALLIPSIAPVGVVVAAYGAALSANTLLNMYERVYEALGSPAILAELALPITPSVQQQNRLANTAPVTLVPDAGQVINLRVRSRNPLTTDGSLPIIAALTPLLQELTVRWNTVMSFLPSRFQLPVPGLQTTVVDSIVSAPEPNELRVASVSAQGISATVASAPGGATLTLSGDPGSTGLDLTVTLAAGSERAGVRTVAIPVRYERAETVRLTAATLAPRCTPSTASYTGPLFDNNGDGTVLDPRYCQTRWYGSFSMSFIAEPRFALDAIGLGFDANSPLGIGEGALANLTLTLTRPLPAPLLNVAGLRAYRATSFETAPPLPPVEMSPYAAVLFCRRASSGTPLPTDYIVNGSLNPAFNSCADIGVQQNERSMLIGEQVSGNQVQVDWSFNPAGTALPNDFEVYVAIVRQVGGRDRREDGSFWSRPWIYVPPVPGPAQFEMSNFVRVALP